MAEQLSAALGLTPREAEELLAAAGGDAAAAIGLFLSLDTPGGGPSPGELVRAASDEVRSGLHGSPEFPRQRSSDMEPALVRGLSESPQDDIALTQLVCVALASAPKCWGWGSLDADKVLVENCSGAGGSNTFKVAALADGEDEVHPRAVALHCRPTDHEDVTMARIAAGGVLFARHGCGPRRIAQGGDWYIERWGASKPAPEWGTPEVCRRVGTLLGRVHQIPTAWFEPTRGALVGKYPVAAAAPPGSHAWVYLARGEIPLAADAERFAEWADDEACYRPRHPAAARVVTAHGDYHPGNVIDGDDGLRCIDFEFTCVTAAVHDLSFGVACCDDARCQRAFLAGYLDQFGEAPAEESVDALLLDAKLGILALWHSGGKLAAWDDPSRAVVAACKGFAADVRGDPELQSRLLEHGLESCVRGSKHFQDLSLRALRECPYYEALQQRHASPSPPHGAAPADVAAAVAGGAAAVSLRAQGDPTKALRVRPGSSRLELGPWRGGGDPETTWLRAGDALQHAATGLFLDAEVKAIFHDCGANWRASGSELHARPRTGCDRQRWALGAAGAADGRTVQHLLDGRVLDVNGWRLDEGQGVNVNLPHTLSLGQRWVVDGAWPADAGPARPLDPAPRLAPADVLPGGAAFHIRAAKRGGFCLAVRDHGYTKDKFEVYLASVTHRDTPEWREGLKWRLVGADQLQHVASGRFLHAETKYSFTVNLNQPWEENHSDLVTRPQDHSDAQRWVWGPGEFHGGKVLHHYKDGRPVDIHGWQFRHGNNVGVENSLHGGCDGCCFVFSVVEGGTGTCRL